MIELLKAFLFGIVEGITGVAAGQQYRTHDSAQ